MSHSNTPGLESQQLKVEAGEEMSHIRRRACDMSRSNTPGLESQQLKVEVGEEISHIRRRACDMSRSNTPVTTRGLASCSKIVQVLGI